MRQYGYYYFKFFISVLLLSGCATAQLNYGPDIFSLPKHQGKPTILILEGEDLRTTQKIGHVGMSSTTVGEEIAALATNHLAAELNEKMGINVQASLTDASEIANAITNKNASGAVAVNVLGLEIESNSTLSRASSLSMHIDVLVYDRQGKKIMSRDFSGFFEQHIDPYMLSTDTTELITRTVRETIFEVFDDAKLTQFFESL